MSLSRFSLVFASVAFFIYGSAFLFFPIFTTSLVGIELSIPSAIIDVRATYGGSVLGTSVIFALFSTRDEWLRLGLITEISVLGGFIFGRVIGLIVDKEPNIFIYILLVGEIVGLLLAIAALRIDAKSQITTEPVT
jgi:hypothetical protein